jgi:hypothetical protein
MKKIVSLFAGVVTLLLCGVAWAQDAAPDIIAAAPAVPADGGPNALTQLTNLVFQILTVVLPILVTWFVHRGIAVFEKKTKINVPDAIENKIDAWVENGIHLAAEKSYKKVAEKTAKLTGSEKLETAADFVFAMAQSRGWLNWSKDAIKAKVEAAIGVHRANGGVPALEDKAVS